LKRSVQTSFSTRSDDRREIEDFSERSVRNHVALELLWGSVPHKLEQTDLVVDDQEHNIVLVNPLELESIT
jgi:hypothetical protein